MVLEIVSTKTRPDLVTITGSWRWNAFFKDEMELSEMMALEVTSTADHLMPTVLVLLDNEVPVGMVAICEDDLEGRPDLNPWLAGLYIDPAHRGQGHAKRLIAALEALAVSHGIKGLFLYTSSAQTLYASVGWQTSETFERDGGTFSIMQKRL